MEEEPTIAIDSKIKVLKWNEKQIKIKIFDLGTICILERFDSESGGRKIQDSIVSILPRESWSYDGMKKMKKNLG